MNNNFNLSESKWPILVINYEIIPIKPNKNHSKITIFHGGVFHIV